MPCLSLRFVRFRLRGGKGGRVCKVLEQKNYGRHCADRNFFCPNPEGPDLAHSLPVTAPLFQPLQAELTRRSERDGMVQDFDIPGNRTKEKIYDFLRDESRRTGIAVPLRRYRESCEILKRRYFLLQTHEGNLSFGGVVTRHCSTLARQYCFIAVSS